MLYCFMSMIANAIANAMASVVNYEIFIPIYYPDTGTTHTQPYQFTLSLHCTDSIPCSDDR